MQQHRLYAGIAQLVEHDLAKVGVASSNLVSRSKKNSYHNPNGSEYHQMQQHRLYAGIAQLVEHDLAKVGVASSNLVSRSKFSYIKLNQPTSV